MITKKITKEPVIFLFKKSWKYSKEKRSILVLFMVLHILANLALLLEPYIVGLFLNELQSNGLSNQNVRYISSLLLGILGVTALFWSLHGPARVIGRNHAFYVRKKYKEDLLKGVLDLDLTWHADRESGNTIDKVNKGSEALFRFTGGIFLVMQVITTLISTIIVIFFFSVPVALIVMVLTILSLSIIFQFDKKLVPQYADLAVLDNKISGKVFDGLSNITSITILRIKNVILKGMMMAIEKPWDLYTKNNVLNEKKWAACSILVRLTVVIPMILYIFYLLQGNEVIVIGSITALYLYIDRMSDTFFTFTYTYEDLIRYKIDIENTETIEKDFIIDKKSKTEYRQYDQIAFENVSFNYFTEQKESKRADISIDAITFNKGERVAVIGESGAGKTTFLKIIHGLYSEAESEIIVDKKKVEGSFGSVDLGTMLVPQEPEIFSSSIRENITFGMDYSDEEVMRFAKMAQFDFVIDDLPKGLDSVVNEKGVNLSGGQKQRLALTRALIFAQDKDLILLDESTSSVDPHNEVLIYKQVFESFRDKTIIASIHKLNLLKQFDRILIFEKGSVADDGSFEELLERNRSFSKMWDEYRSEHKERK